jgi:hypothetical protein
MPNLRGERVGHDDVACARSAQAAFVPTSVTTRWPCRWLRARDRNPNGTRRRPFAGGSVSRLHKHVAWIVVGAPRDRA